MIKSTNNTRQAAWIGIGSLFSFGFTIVSSMILSRYFDKSDYGTYKQVMYVYHTLLTIFTLGLPRAFTYFLPRVDTNQAKNLITKLTKLFVFLGSIFSLFLFICARPIGILLNNEDLIKAIRIFSPVPLLMLPTMGFEGILSTYRKNIYNAIYTISTRLIMLICVCVPVVFMKGGYIEALIGFSISSLISSFAALYLKYLPVKNAGNDKCNITFREIFAFSIPMLTASLWGIILASADQFFISRYFGNEVFAEFSNGSMQLPFVGMVVGASTTVISPIISRVSAKNENPKEELYPLWLSVFEKSAKLIYPLVIFSIFFADEIMLFLYGSKYTSSGTYFIIKSIYSFFAIIMYAPIVVNIGKVKYYSNTHMCAAIAIVILEYLSVHIIHSPYAISAISLLVQLGKSFALLYIVSSYFKVKIIHLFPIKTLFLILVPSSAILIIERIIFTHILNINSISTLIIAFSIYSLVFYAYSLFVNLNYKSILNALIH